MSKLIMFLDTETSGLPIKKGYNNYYPYTDLDKYEGSRIVQISWVVSDLKGNKKTSRSFIITPDGFTIPEGAAEVHGITTEIANEEGFELCEVFDYLQKDLKNVKQIVAHNALFDMNIIMSEISRANKGKLLKKMEAKHFICTGESTKDILKIPLKYGGHKMPSLGELYKWCFKKEIEGLHDSECDVQNLYEIFFFIKNKKKLKKYVRVQI